MIDQELKFTDARDLDEIQTCHHQPGQQMQMM